MKTTIILKEFSVLPAGAVRIGHEAVPVNADLQPQPTTESVKGFHFPPDKSGESFRELLHQRSTTPFVSVISYHRWGINE